MTTTKEHNLVKFCAYCHSKQSKLRRCGGCKIIFYCSTDCQSNHWELIHKTQCKKWRQKYKNKTFTQEEYDQFDIESNVKLYKMKRLYYGEKVDKIKDMNQKQDEIRQKEKTTKQPLFQNIDVTKDRDFDMLNIMMSVILDVFDRDKDGKLNINEWQCILKELGFEHLSKDTIFHMIHDIGLVPEYYPSINCGIYGSYLYPTFDPANSEILFEPKHIIETLRICAYIRSRIDKEEDIIDLNDNVGSLAKAFSLMIKLYGHAQGIACLGEVTETEFFDIIKSVIPELNNDIVSVIYNYHTYTGQHVINVSWHRIKWLHFFEDQDGLWDIYDVNRNDEYYDLFYVSRQSEKGYKDTYIDIEICDDCTKCNEKLELLKQGDFAFSMVDMMERNSPKSRWCLGSTPSYIPTYSFDIKDHAVLIGKVLEFHHFDPKMCHYIYVGIGVRGDRESKEMMVDAFREIYDSNTKYRPSMPKKPMLFNHTFDFL